MLFSVISTVAGPPLIGYAIDNGIRKNNMDAVIISIVTFLILQGLGFFGFRVQLANMATAGQAIIQRLRDELFEHVQFLSVSFFTPYEPGRLIARIISDVNTLREAITLAVVGSVRKILTLIGIVISMLLINPLLTLVAFGVLVVLVIIANFWRIYIHKPRN
ncbi:MAG: ABC transporter transmembrane domain-containing protein [Anaerolineae bacterium]|nr:ABC transporter transmembrane domain-containing protein [Anaerolineae bacterium]